MSCGRSRGWHRSRVRKRGLCATELRLSSAWSRNANIKYATGRAQDRKLVGNVKCRGVVRTVGRAALRAEGETASGRTALRLVSFLVSLSEIRPRPCHLRYCDFETVEKRKMESITTPPRPDAGGSELGIKPACIGTLSCHHVISIGRVEKRVTGMTSNLYFIAATTFSRMPSTSRQELVVFSSPDH